MKSRFIKMAIVAASALAFMNCSNEAVNSVTEELGENIPSSSSAEPDIPEINQPLENEFLIVPDEPVLELPGEGEVAVPDEGVIVFPTDESFLPGDTPVEFPVDPVEPVVPAVSSSSAIAEPESSSAEIEGFSSSEEPASSSSEAILQAPKGIFLAYDTDENKNYMEVEYFTNTGDNGGAILAYPKRLSETQKHGVVLWGPGGGSKPTDYEGVIRRLASHGFVVIATSESPDGTGRGKPALDWLEKKNNTPDDPLYQKLDMTKVGASGHSMGGLQSEEMLIADDRVITAILNNSGDMGHQDGARVPANKTFAIVYGEGGMERPNAEADYGNPGVKAPACLIKMTGGVKGNPPECQNGECGWGHGSGPWGGMAATVAWMRWHLGGEDFRKNDFVGTNGKYINGPIIGQQGYWKGQCKNF